MHHFGSYADLFYLSSQYYADINGLKKLIEQETRTALKKDKIAAEIDLNIIIMNLLLTKKDRTVLYKYYPIIDELIDRVKMLIDMIHSVHARYDYRSNRYDDYRSNREAYRRPNADIESSFLILGLSVTATAVEIKAAFRRLALKCHPDQGGSSEQFIRISNARDKCLRYLQKG